MININKIYTVTVHDKSLKFNIKEKETVGNLQFQRNNSMKHSARNQKVGKTKEKLNENAGYK